MYTYINLNGQYGLDQTTPLCYETAQQVIDQMDRLGIWQTVMEYPAAANSLYRNRKLLQDIQQIPHWRERIIPSFQIDPCSAIELGAVEKLVDMVQTYHPCCVSIRPKRSQHRLRLADMVLDHLQHLNPVVLLDQSQIYSDAGGDDLLYLANRYPNMRFVIRQAMYVHYPFLFDVMRRAKNIYVDNSRLHTNRALNIFIRHFGEDRVLFSTDSKGNNGAAMAAIAWADLPEQTKNNIRYGNFINLFSDPADREFLRNNLKAIENHVANRFWTPFVEQQQAPDTEIYDVHTHMGAYGTSWYLEEMSFEGQVKNFEQAMERFHVKKIISSAFGMPHNTSCLEMEKACAGKEDRFHGYVRYNPNYVEFFNQEFLDACLSRGYFVGLKTLPSYTQIDIRDETYAPMFRYANERKLPILIHTWGDKFAQPIYCAEMARKYPNATLILGHTGGNLMGRLQCEQLAKDPTCSNLYFEYCGSFTTDRPWEESLQHIDYRRVLYGTDSCLHDIAWEMGRLLSSDICDEQLIAILGGNAKKLFAFD